MNLNLAHTYFADLAQTIETIPTDSIVSRTILKDGQLKVIVFAFAPGQELSQHTASRSTLRVSLRCRAFM